MLFRSGLALGEVTGGTIAFVDANLRWPAISQLVGDERGSDDGERKRGQESAHPFQCRISGFDGESPSAEPPESPPAFGSASPSSPSPASSGVAGTR